MNDSKANEWGEGWEKFTYPRNTLPSDSKENIVEEEECDGRFSPLPSRVLSQSRVRLIVPNADGDNRVAKELAGGGVHHHLASSPALDVGDSNKREKKIGHGVAGCE